jgi:hypothetical protein
MKLMCEFSGWFEIDDNVKLTYIGKKDSISGVNNYVVKTLQEWIEYLKDMNEPFRMSDFILESFNDAVRDSTDGEFDTLDLEIIEDTNE